MSSLHPLVPSLLLALAAAPLPALADRPASRPANLQQQEAQALARLSSPDLHNYFEARRQLERRSSDQRLAQLRQLEDCLERTRQRAGAETCLAQGRQRQWQQRQQSLGEMSALRQRYGLPALPAEPSHATPAPMPRPQWLPVSPRQSWLPPQQQRQPEARLPYGWY